MYNYILPRIKYSERFEKLNESPILNTDVNYIEDLDSILSLSRTCIVAEPGYGKTRLLSEIYELCIKQGEKCVLIDLKKIDRDFRRLEESLQDENILKSKNSFKVDGLSKSENFKLSNTEDIVICLDALDEVKSSRFNEMVDWILEFSRCYNNIRLIVSCRTTFIVSKHILFENAAFHFLSIEKFSEKEVKQYFKQNNIDDEVVSKILRLLHSDNDMCIKVPRYLTMTVELVLNDKIDIANLTKSDLFEKFIYKKLEKEDETLGQEQKDITKRLLEQLALVMGIYQNNSITKDELMTFFNDIESDLKYYFLEHIELNELYERSLLKNNNTSIEFENTEFREYLAAKEITRLGNVEQVIFDLAINANLRDIYPSWYNTIKFLIDFQPSLLTKVIQFGKIKTGEIKSHDYFRFLVNVQSDKISTNDKKEIFTTVFKYYQAQAYPIDYDILSALTNYFSRPLEPILKKYIEENENFTDSYYVRVGNVIMLIHELLEKGITEIDIDYWKYTIIELTKVDNDVVKRTSVRILGFFKDISLLQKVFDNVKDSSRMVWENIIDTCTMINPNDPFTIECIVTGVRRGYWFVRDNLSLITESNAIKYLLTCFINDDNFMIKFIEDEGTEGKQDSIIINNIKGNWDTEIANLSKQLVDKALANKYISAGRSKFITELAEILNETTEDYLMKLLYKSKDSNFFWIDLCYLCAQIIKVNQVNDFIVKAKEIDKTWLAFQVLQVSRFFQNNFQKSVYEEGRKYFEEEYRNAEEERKSYEVSSQKNIQKLYEQFKYKLEPERGIYQNDVFEYVVKNYKKLIPLIKGNPKDKECLRHLIINEVFERIDPCDYEVSITERDSRNMSISYSIDSSVVLFENSIRLARMLNIDVKDYRKKIISFIPYAINESLDDIFELIPNPSDDEINMLLNIYDTPRKDDLAEFHPYSFIKAYRQYKLISATSIIKGFIENDNISVSDKIYAIKAIGDNIDNKEYIQELFLRYYIENPKEELLSLAEQCNEILIEKYHDKEAILWRLNCIKERAFELEKKDTSSNFRMLSDREVELSSKRFAAPIMKVRDESLREDYYNLLQYSFDLIRKSEKYRRYSYYIWDIVLKYFENLKITGKSKYLLDLEKWVNENSNSLIDINWFKYRVQELRKVYLNETDKPVTMYECIKQYNRLKHNTYLDITCSRDLLELIHEIINDDLRKWIELGGAYKFIEESTRNQEVMIQKTIKTQFENALLRRGIRDIGIIREPQLLDDIRPDFLISYGFIGSVIIEVKRITNPQVKNKKKREQYASKLVKYIEGTNSDYLIYLLFNTKKEDELRKYLSEVEECYKDNTQIFVKGLDCVGEVDA